LREYKLVVVGGGGEWHAEMQPPCLIVATRCR